MEEIEEIIDVEVPVKGNGQPPQDDLQKYYNYLKTNGADVPPTYQSFQKTLSNETDAKKYYDYVKSKGFDAPPTFESFSETLQLKKNGKNTPVSPIGGSGSKNGAISSQNIEESPTGLTEDLGLSLFQQPQPEAQFADITEVQGIEIPKENQQLTPSQQKIVESRKQLSTDITPRQEVPFEIGQGIRTATQKLQANPNDDAALYELGYYQNQLGNTINAENFFTQALEKNPNNDKALEGLGHIASLDGDFEKALKYNEDAFKINPTTARLNNIAQMNLELGNTDVAKRQAEEAVKVSPEDFRSWQIKSLAEEKLGNKEQAIQDLFKAQVEYQKNLPVPTIYRDYIEYQKKKQTTPFPELLNESIESGHENLIKYLGNDPLLAGIVDIPFHIQQNIKAIDEGLVKMNTASERMRVAMQSDDVNAKEKFNALLQQLTAGAHVGFSAAMLTPHGYAFAQGIHAADQFTGEYASKVLMTPLKSFTPETDSETWENSKEALDVVLSLLVLGGTMKALKGKEKTNVDNTVKKIKSGGTVTGEELKTSLDVINETLTPENVEKIHDAAQTLPQATKSENIQPYVSDILSNETAQGQLSGLQKEVNTILEKEFVDTKDLLKVEELTNEIQRINDTVDKEIGVDSSGINAEIEKLRQEKKDLYSETDAASLQKDAAREKQINSELLDLLKQRQQIRTNLLTKKIQDNATTQRKVAESDKPEHIGTPTLRPETQPSGSDSVIGGGEIKEETQKEVVDEGKEQLVEKTTETVTDEGTLPKKEMKGDVAQLVRAGVESQVGSSNLPISTLKLDFNKIKDAEKSGELIIDESGITKSYAWHSNDGRFEVTSKDKTGHRGRVYQEYSIKIDGKEIAKTREYSEALKHTQDYLEQIISPKIKTDESKISTGTGGGKAKTETQAKRETEVLKPETKPKGEAERVPPSILNKETDLKGKSDADIEKRMSEIEVDKTKRDEFDALEKEMEKRERESVFNVSLDKVNDAVNVLMKKEKEQPNGFGSFIEKKDASETKQVAKKYLNPKEISDAELREDFKNAIMGNPDTWYADGLKLRESMNEAANRGIKTADLIKAVEKEFQKDGFSAEDAHATIARVFQSVIQKEVPKDILELAEKEGKGKEATKEEINVTTKALEEVSRDNPKVFEDIASNIKTSIVGDNRKPETVYHGTNNDFDVFDFGKSGESTGARTASLGMFFTDNPNVTKNFTDPKKPIVKKATLKLENPFVIGFDKLEDRIRSAKDPFISLQDAIVKFSNKKKWSEVTRQDVLNWKDKVKELGYDGIVIKRTIMDGSGGYTARTIDNPYHNFYIVFDNKNIFQHNPKHISEAYHKAKSDGSNPELVKAVDEAIEKETKPKTAPIVKEEVAEEKTPSKETIESKEGRLTEDDFTDDGDLTDVGFDKATNNLKTIISDVADKFGIPEEPLRKHYNISGKGEYFSSQTPILNVSESINYDQLINTFKKVASELYPEKIDDVYKKINQHSDELLNAIESDTPFTADKNLAHITNALEEINSRFNDSIKPQKAISEKPTPPKEELPSKEGEVIAKPEAKVEKTELAKQKVTAAGEALKKALKAKTLPEGVKKSGLDVDTVIDKAVQLIHEAIDAKESIEKAIAKGLEHIKKSKWYEALTKEEREGYDSLIEDHLAQVAKDKEIAQSGIAHAETEAAREEFGTPQYEGRVRKSDIELDAEAEKQIKDGYNIENLVSRLEDGEHPNDVETVILSKYKAGLEAKIEKDPSNENLAEWNRLVDATDKAGSEQGAAFRQRQGLEFRDESLAGFFTRERDVNQNAELTETQKNRVIKEHEEITKAQEEWNKERQRLMDENTRLKAQAEIKKTKSAAPPKTKRTHEDFVAERKNIIDQLKQEWKGEGDIKRSGLPITDKMVVLTGKLMKSYVEEGAIKLEEVIKKLTEDLKGVIPEITERDVNDIIAGEYKKPKPTRNAIAATLFDLREQARLTNKLDALLRGEKPKNEKQRIKRNQEIESLRQKIKDFQKEKTNAEKLAKEASKEAAKKHPDQVALDKLKSRQQTEIKKLQDQLDSGDFARPEKKAPIKLDKEARDARDELIKLRQEREVRIMKQEYQNRTKYEVARDKIVDVLNVPRTLMSSMDYSAPLRQAIIPTLTHPSVSIPAFGEMFRQSVSQKRFDRWFHDVKDHPRYNMAIEQAKLYIADPHDPRLTAKEEAFMNNLAEKIPVIGKLIKGSERAYVGYLNKMRWDLFNRFADRFEESGRTFENSPELYEGLASWVNNSTGRGKLGAAESIAPILNTALFSPRLIASRLNMLNPGYYMKLPKEVRTAAMKDNLKFIGMGLTVLAVAELAGADVEVDPRSTDFGKIKVGNTRWDIWGGYQQYIRVLAQMASAVATGQTKSAATGELKDLPFGKNAGDIGLSFARGKLAPIPSAGWDIITGKNIMGEDVTPLGLIESRMLPLVQKDVRDAMQDSGLRSLFTAGIPAVFGVGVQTYLPSGYSKEDLKDPTYKFLYSKHLNLKEPPQGEMTKSEYNDFIDKREEVFKNEWNAAIEYGAYINEEGNPTVDPDAAQSIKQINELSPTELSQLMKSISTKATREAKKKEEGEEEEIELVEDEDNGEEVKEVIRLRKINAEEN